MKHSVKSVFIKAAAALCALLTVLSLAACAKKPEAAEQEQYRRSDEVFLPGKEPINQVKTSRVVSDSAFANCGNFIFVAAADSEYTVTYENAGRDIEWSIFVFDRQYSEDLAKMPEENEPALVGPGAVQVKKGQYGYLHCSVNELNAEEPVPGAYAEFTGAGLPF